MSIYSARKPSVIPADGWELPIYACYRAIRGLPFFRFLFNNLTQKCIFYPDKMEYRVLRTRQSSYERVSRVSVMKIPHVIAFQIFTNYFLVFDFKDSVFSLSVKLKEDDEDTLRDALDFLRSREVPLAESALEILGVS